MRFRHPGPARRPTAAEPSTLQQPGRAHAGRPAAAGTVANAYTLSTISRSLEIVGFRDVTAAERGETALLVGDFQCLPAGRSQATRPKHCAGTVPVSSSAWSAA